MKVKLIKAKIALESILRVRLWRQLTPRLVPSEPSPETAHGYLIIASDPWEVVGSRGDDAMLSTIIRQIRQADAQARIGVVAADRTLSPLVAELGMAPERIWNQHGYDAYIARLKDYGTVYMVGADVMDGHYSEAEGVRFWALCDIAARMGRRVNVIGCSFSDSIAPRVRQVIAGLSPRLTVFARERFSKIKFDRVSNIEAQLVADSAFLLPPETTAIDQPMVDDWSARQREAGRFICGLNVHPMIFPGYDMARVQALNVRLADLLPRLAERFPVSFLLVPHDFREGAQGDNAALAPLYEMLRPTLNDRVCFARSEARASELKSLVARADLLVTGRMHLGVGALSMGVPIWGLSPQDKFAGLLEHFGLADLRITPNAAEDAEALERFFISAFESWREVGEQVRGRLPEVKKKSMLNFHGLQAAPAAA